MELLSLISVLLLHQPVWYRDGEGNTIEHS